MTTVGQKARARRVTPQPLTWPTRRPWWADAVPLAVWASLLVVVALWVSHGGVQQLTAGASSAWIATGRLTGLVSSDLVLLQLLAMARIPLVERAVGQDALTRWHRLLGFSSINLLLAHAVTITIGYALRVRSGFFTELWSLVTTAPGMLLATAGTGLFVLVAVTSVRMARRRLRYESWHLLHLYAYLAGLLALPHQLWTGADFIASPLARAYWWTLYGLALVSVLVFRVALPLRTSLRHRLVVTRVVAEAPGVVSVHIGGANLHRLAAAPGQFFVWRFLTGPGWTRGHPLSLSAAPTTAGLRITLATGGDDGPRLASMRPGTNVLVEGPHGLLTPHVRTRRGLVLMGAGLGLAPLISLLQDAVRRGETASRPATVVRRLRTSPHQPPWQAELAELQRTGHIQLVDLVGPRGRSGPAWLPEHLSGWTATAAVHALIPDIEDSDVFVCGTAPWSEAVAADLRAAGVPADALHVERFTW